MLSRHTKRIEQFFRLLWHIRLQQDAGNAQTLCGEVDDSVQVVGDVCVAGVYNIFWFWVQCVDELPGLGVVEVCICLF